MTTAAPEAPVTEAPATPAPEAQAAPPAPPEPAQPPQAPPSPPPAPAAAPAVPKPAPPPSAPQQATGDSKPEPKAKDDGELTKLREELQRAQAERDRWKRQSRVQETRSKTNHEQVRGLDAIVRQIAEKVGVEWDETPDPGELTRRLTEATATASSAKVELAVFRSAARAGADPNALLDSRAFMARTGGLDPDAADFPDQVAELVAEAAQQPQYQANRPPPVLAPQPADNFQQPPPKAQPPAPASGADFSGAPGGHKLWTEADYEAWKAAGQDPEVLEKAIDAGLLAGIGIGKPRPSSRARRG